MSEPTLSAVLLFLAALVQSSCYLCHKLPESRRPAWFPADRLSIVMFNITWVLLFGYGAFLAWKITPWLGLVAALFYFLVLPFVFQSALARLLGFRSLRELVAYLDSNSGKQKG